MSRQRINNSLSYSFKAVCGVALSLAATFVTPAYGHAETVTVEGLVVFYGGLTATAGGSQRYAITNRDVPYWSLGPSGSNASLPWTSRVTIVADSTAGRVSITGNFDDLVFMKYPQGDIIRTGIRGNVQMTWTGVTFTDEHVRIGTDPTTGTAQIIGIGNLGSAFGAGLVTYEHNDPAVFGPSKKLTVVLQQAQASIAASNAKWGFIVPQGAAKREMNFFWGPIASGSQYSYFEPLNEMGAWFMAADPISILGNSYRLKGDFHIGASLKPIIPELACVLDLNSTQALAVFHYDNQNPMQVTLPVSMEPGRTNVVFGPPTVDAGQPTVFEPGFHSGVYQAPFQKAAGLAWVLDYNDTGSHMATVTNASQHCGPVTPTVDCIEPNLDGTFTAYFGYKNDNNFIFTIPTGEFNTFTAPPYDRGQPTSFQPGTYGRVVSSVFGVGDSVAYTLGAATATANITSPLCSGDGKPLCSSSPSGQPYALDCFGVGQLSATLDSSGSQSVNGLPLSYLWSTDCPGAVVGQPNNPLSQFAMPGPDKDLTCSVTLQVSDGIGTQSCVTPVNLTGCSFNCGESDILSDQFVVDSSARAIASLVKRVARKVGKLGKRKQAQELRTEAKKLYDATWNSIWSFESVQTQCEGESTQCAKISNQPTISSIEESTGALVTLLSSAADQYSKASGKKKSGKKLIKRAKELQADSQASIAKIPSTQTLCSQ